MHKGFFTDVMQHRPALFTSMLAFNGLSKDTLASDGQSQPMQALCAARLAAYGSASGAAIGLSEQAISLLSSLPVVQRHLMASASAQEQTEHAFLDTTSNAHSAVSFWDFSEESRRLVFLSAQEIALLLRTFGTALHAKHFAHLLLNRDVVALREALGPELYTYGLVRGRFQVGSITRFFSDPHHDVFLHMENGTEQKENQAMAILRCIERDGDLALALCMANWPESLQKRMVATLGRELPCITDADQSIVRGVWFVLKKLLLREVAPQWAPCFD